MSAERCPGIYCGRTLEQNGTWSDCGVCPRGFRVNENYACTKCESDMSLYSWLYFAFMASLPLMLHSFFINLDAKDRKFSRKQIILTICCTVEVSISMIVSILIMEPFGELKLYSCDVKRINDFYTLFYNPFPNYVNMHCTSEAAYPLQTIVLIFYFLCLITMFLLRPLVCAMFDIRSGKAPIYSALYFLPLLTFIHAVACGLIYYSFPYLSIAISMITNGIHYSLKLDQSCKALIKTSVMEIKNVVIIVVQWLLLAFGIISLGHNYVLLCLVPFPSIFYILTVRFTDPAEFRDVEVRACNRE